MNLEVSEDPDVGGEPHLRCECAGCEPALNTFCDTSGRYPFNTLRWPLAGDGVSFPSLVELTVFLDVGEDGPAQYLRLAIDFFHADQPTARACILFARLINDAVDAVPEPACADRGAVRLTGRPAEAADVADLHGEAELAFDQIEIRGDIFENVKVFVTF